MKWTSTWILLALAALLFAYIALVERHAQPSSEMAHPPARLLEFKPAEVTSLQLRRSAELFLRLDRTNGEWYLSFPISYPAQPVAIAGFLQELSALHSGTFLTPDELEARHQTVAEFGLDVPVATLILLHAGGRQEIRFGAKTPVGDRVYLQTQDSPNIFVVPAGVFNRLPASPNDWRDPLIVDLQKLSWDRLEFRTPTRGYAIQLDATHRNFSLTKPSPARADGPKVLHLLSALQQGRVVQFVQDNPGADLEPFGLQTPVAELVFGLGTNAVRTIQFGKSPTNDPASVYALLGSHTNVVLVSQSLLDSVRISHADLRDRHLLTFAPDRVDMVEVGGQTNWVLHRLPRGGWAVAGAPPMNADDELVRFLFSRLERLQGAVERDVVTDYTSYGLTTPALQYRLLSLVTNANGLTTNRLIGALDFGMQQEDKVFVRRLDEQSVYSIPQTEFELLPRETWQLRHRQVWSFTTNEITAVTLQMPDRSVTLLRTGPARWELAPGSQGVINDLLVEELMFRLGDLHADFWVARGEDQRAQFGFNTPSFQITIELKSSGGQPRMRTVAFGQRAPNQFPYALAEVDGQSVIFEFPKKLYFELVTQFLKSFWAGTALPL